MVAPSPHVSVIVPCYQAERTLKACLESLLAQRTKLSYEVLLVENGSRDGSLEIARSLMDEGGPLRVIEEPTVGAYAARNRGIREARGEVLLFTDADCRAAPEWVESLARALADPDVILAGGEIEDDPTQRGLLARYARSCHILSQSHTLRHPLGGFLQTANMGVRRTDALAAGCFDEKLYSGGDADFCWRVRRLKPKASMRLVPEARVEHFNRETLRDLWRQYFRYGQADVMLARKHGRRLVHCAGKLTLDLLRVVLLPLALVLGAVRGLIRRDALPAVAPFLRVARLLARRRGQLHALLRPGRLRRA